MQAQEKRWRLRLIGFGSGFYAGLAALFFQLVLRLGGLGVYPPESAFQAFLSIVPASIEEPSVQLMGDFAGELGVIVASLVAAVVYGVFGIVFARYVLPRMGRSRYFSQLEIFLAYSLVPWLFFGLVILPLVGVSFFGESSVLASAGLVWIFPVSLLLSQLSFGFVLYIQMRQKVPIVEESLEPRKQMTPENSSRRSFIEKGVVAAGSLALAGLSGERIISSLIAQSSSITTPGSSLDLQDAQAIFRDPRLSSLVNNEVTSNNSFYRVAIDIFDPAVDLSNWNLALEGLVSNPRDFSYDELLNLPKIDQYTTFECVSNLLNGNLISNAKWTGFKISDLVSAVGGLASTAKYVVFRSVDGYSVGIPVSKAMMEDSILAYRMNDETLPVSHGYPLRAVIPGLYGMMSAKFINRIQVIDSTYSGYWQTRGWSNVATVNTETFIWVPGDGSSASLSEYNGSVMLGGVAFAGDRGISKVEVSVDGGSTWQEAQLKKPISDLTWAIWAFDWHPSQTGGHDVYARATDGSGAVQTSDPNGTFPSGATGYVTIHVNVSN